MVSFSSALQVKLRVGPGQEAVIKLAKTGGNCRLFHYLFRMAPHVCIAPSTRANACETLNFLSVFPQVHHSAWKNRSTESLQNSLRRPLLAQFDSFYTTEVIVAKSCREAGLFSAETWAARIEHGSANTRASSGFRPLLQQKFE